MHPSTATATATAEPSESSEAPTTSRRGGWHRLLLGAGWALAAVVAVMHVLAPAMSAGYPHLSTFGWGLVVAGYVTYGGVVAGLVGVHRDRAGEPAGSALSEAVPDAQSDVAA